MNFTFFNKKENTNVEYTNRYEQRMKQREKKYDTQLKEMKLRQQVFDKKSELIVVKKSMRRWKMPTTTKLLMAFIFINCSVVEIYSMAVMWYLQDLSSLYSLITAVVTESISFAIYACKAYNETKQEELIKLERDKMEVGIQDIQMDEPNDIVFVREDVDDTSDGESNEGEDI